MGGGDCSFSPDLYQLSPTSLHTFLHQEAGSWGVHTSSEQAVLLGPAHPWQAGRQACTHGVGRPSHFQEAGIHASVQNGPTLKLDSLFFKSLSGQIGAQDLDQQAQDTSLIVRSVTAFAFPSITSEDLL